MRLPSTLLSHLAGLLACTSCLHATLVWETTTLERRAEFEQEELVVSFAFRNNGTTPVTIASLEASCGCTVPSLAQRTYAPGEAGTLDVSYRIDGQTGPQTRTISVKTDEAGKTPTVLTLKVDVPRLFDLSPRLVTWEKDDETLEKRVEIALHRDGTTVALEHNRNDHLELALASSSAGSRYTLRLRPKSTGVAFRETIHLRIESPGLPSRVLAVYAVLR